MVYIFNHSRFTYFSLPYLFLQSSSVPSVIICSFSHHHLFLQSSSVPSVIICSFTHHHLFLQSSSHHLFLQSSVPSVIQSSSVPSVIICSFSHPVIICSFSHPVIICSFSHHLFLQSSSHHLFLQSSSVPTVIQSSYVPSVIQSSSVPSVIMCSVSHQDNVENEYDIFKFTPYVELHIQYVSWHNSVMMTATSWPLRFLPRENRWSTLAVLILHFHSSWSWTRTLYFTKTQSCFVIYVQWKLSV